MEKIVAFKPTRDDWAGNFVIHYQGDINLVRVSTFPLHAWKTDMPLLWRVCIWGNDDCGMEKDFDNPKDAMKAYQHIVALEFVNKTELFSLGFGNA
jgi:hypothetical protein